MPLATAVSINGVPIRLTEERWEHIVDRHSEIEAMQRHVLQVISDPDLIYEGKRGELIAQGIAGHLYLLVTYRETSREDGFVVTAHLGRRPPRKKALWTRQV